MQGIGDGVVAGAGVREAARAKTKGRRKNAQLVHIKKRVVVLGLGVARPDEAELACASGRRVDGDGVPGARSKSRTQKHKPSFKYTSLPRCRPSGISSTMTGTGTTGIGGGGGAAARLEPSVAQRSLNWGFFSFAFGGNPAAFRAALGAMPDSNRTRMPKRQLSSSFNSSTARIAPSSSSKTMEAVGAPRSSSPSSMASILPTLAKAKRNAGASLPRIFVTATARPPAGFDSRSLRVVKGRGDGVMVG